MSEQEYDRDNKNRWQLRYYAALDELEDKERSWNEVERLFRQLISRLTLAADNRHQLLTQQLTELRNAVRDGRDILPMRELIESISEHVAELDKIRKKEKRQSHPAVLVARIIEKINIPRHLNRDFRKLKRDAKNLSRDSSSESMNGDFVAFLKKVIEPSIEQRKEARKSKLLSRILQRTKLEEQTNTPGAEKKSENIMAQILDDTANKAENLQQSKMTGIDFNHTQQKLVAPAVGDLLLQLTLKMPDVVRSRINFQVLKKHTNRARSRRDLLAIVDVVAQQVEAAYLPDDDEPVNLESNSVEALSNVLKTLFSQLELPMDLREKISELELLYTERSDDPDVLIHCLSSITDIVSEVCQRLAVQRNELEGFFIQLSTRLKDLDAGLQKTILFNTTGAKNNQAMDTAIHDEIDSIQDTIESDDDTSRLKEKIKIRLDVIDLHIQNFSEKEAERIKESNSHINQLQTKIEKMEEDCEHLRSRLEETQQQAYLDVLTGIPNRQAYEVRISEEVARCRRYESMLCMIVWDVDKFKLVNDNYGHAAGDRVLKVIAEILNANIRETDFLARFGGEEFVMLLPQIGIDATQTVAEKLRQSICETPFHFRDNEVPVTVSAGIAQLHLDETPNSLFERADKALYIAKEKGRNRTEIAEQV